MVAFANISTAPRTIAREAAGGPQSDTHKDTFRLPGSRAGWRYDSSDKRDLRIDFVRGLAIVVMVTNHLTAGSYLNAFMQGRIYASAAEAFVFLAGLVLGMISLGRLERGGFGEASGKLLVRALTLYKTYLVLAGVAAVATFVRPGAAAPIFESMNAPWWRVAIAAPLLQLPPQIVDVLQLYVLCIAGSPSILYALRRGWTIPLLVASVSFWGLHQLHPYAFSGIPLGREHPYFALAAWQLLYVVGFAFGYHRQVIGLTWSKIPRGFFLALALPLVVAALVANHYDTRLGVWPAAVTQRTSWIALVDRSSLGPVRVVTVAALFVMLWTVIDACWRPLQATVGPVLVTLGQRSLYVYIVHVPFVVAWHALSLPTLSMAASTVGQAMVLVTLWLMVRTRFLFRLIPS